MRVENVKSDVKSTVFKNITYKIRFELICKVANNSFKKKELSIIW